METSSFFDAQLPRIRETRELGPVLDLASGRGRHARACVAEGLPTLALDRSDDALVELADAARHAGAPGRGALLCVRCDLETGHGIPVKAGTCGTILVFCFLFRPLAAAITAALAPGGLLVYETFTVAQRALGTGPRRDAFLLAPGELPTLFGDLEVVEYAEGRVEGPRPRHTARLAARKPLGA